MGVNDCVLFSWVSGVGFFGCLGLVGFSFTPLLALVYGPFRHGTTYRWCYFSFFIRFLFPPLMTWISGWDVQLEMWVGRCCGIWGALKMWRGQFRCVGFFHWWQGSVWSFFFYMRPGNQLIRLDFGQPVAWCSSSSMPGV
jgi:hypothetical protein